MADHFEPENSNEEAVRAGHWVEGQAHPDVNNQQIQHVLLDNNSLMHLISRTSANQGSQDLQGTQQVLINPGQYGGEVMTTDGRQVTQIIVELPMEENVVQFVTDQSEETEESKSVPNDETGGSIITENTIQNDASKTAENVVVNVKEFEAKPGALANSSITQSEPSCTESSTDMVVKENKNDKKNISPVNIHVRTKEQYENHIQITEQDQVENLELKSEKEEEEVYPPGTILTLCPLTGKMIPQISAQENDNTAEPVKQSGIDHVDIEKTTELVAQALATRLRAEQETEEEVVITQKASIKPSAVPRVAETSAVLYLSDKGDEVVQIDERDTVEPPDNTGDKKDIVDESNNENDSDVGISAFYTPVSKTPKMKRQILQNSKYSDESKQNIMMSLLQEQRLKGQNCDMFIEADSKREWAHKCIISVSTSYFDKFKTDLESSEKGSYSKYNLTGVMKGSTLHILLDYIYTGAAVLNYEKAVEFLEIMEDLGDGCLKLMEMCVEHIKSCINKANLPSILVLSEKRNLSDLYDFCINFAKENLESMIQTEELMKLSLVNVVAIVSGTNDKNSHSIEHIKLQFICNWVVYDTSERMDHYDELCSHVNFRLVEKPVFEMMMKSELYSHANLWEHPVTLAILDKNNFAARTRGRPRKSLPVSLKVRQSFSDQNENQLEVKEEKDTVSMPVKKRKYNPKDFDESESQESSKEDKKSDEDEKIQYDIDEQDKDYKVGDDISTPARHKRGRGRPKGSYSKKHTTIKKLTTVITRTGRVIKRRFEEEPELPTKLIKEGKQDKVGRKFYFCPRDGCNFLARDRQRLIDHISMKHDGVKRHVCYVCNKMFSSVRHLQRHKKLHMDDKPICCDHCTYNTTRNDLLKSHIRHQHPSEAVEMGMMTPKELDNIKEKLTTPSRRGRKPSIKSQKVKVTPDTPLECKHCNKTFTSMLGLRSHIKGHGMEDTLLCETCGFTTKHYASMRLHRLNHSDLDKPYKCHIEGCSYASFRKSRLTDHVNKHLNIRNFICSVCGKGFTTRKHMTRHELTHADVKPFLCSECDYGTARSDKLKEHIRSRHPERAIEAGLMSADSKIPVIRRKRHLKKIITRQPVSMVPQPSAVPMSTAQAPETGPTITTLQAAEPTGALLYTGGGHPTTVQVETYTPYTTVNEEVMAYFAHYQEYEVAGPPVNPQMNQQQVAVQVQQPPSHQQQNMQQPAVTQQQAINEQSTVIQQPSINQQSAINQQPALNQQPS